MKSKATKTVCMCARVQVQVKQKKLFAGSYRKAKDQGYFLSNTLHIQDSTHPWIAWLGT